MILSGAAQMNPASILLWEEKTGLHIKASAKEELLKQHTVERAIEIFKSALAAVRAET